MPIIIGHRGAMGYEPENTLRSFQKALDSKVDMIEFDVFRCKSGELVIIHDKTLDRTTNGSGFVADKTYRELSRLDAGKGEKIPTLQQVLDLVNRKCKVNIELKGEDVAKPVAEVIEQYINKGWHESDFLVTSFDEKELFNFAGLSPKIKIGMSFSKSAEIDQRISVLAVKLSIATKKIVEQAKKQNVDVYVYPVNTKNDAVMLKEIGVVGFYSDFPDLI